MEHTKTYQEFKKNSNTKFVRYARYEKPVAYGSLTKEQFNAEIEKGMEDIKASRVYSADEVEAEMKRKFGI